MGRFAAMCEGDIGRVSRLFGSPLRQHGGGIQFAPMDGAKKWMLDNQVFSGIIGVVLAAIFAVIAYFYQRRRKASQTASPTIQQSGQVGTGNVVNVQGPVGSLAVGAAAPASPPAEDVRVDVKGVTPALEMPSLAGHIDPQSLRAVPHKVWMHPAQLKIVCHNLTGTPVVIDQVRILNVDSNKEVACYEGDTKRMEGFGSIEMHLNLNQELFETLPQWRGLITVTTVRGGSFNSKPFQWRKR
jgi:hypothetical protein